MGKEFEDYLSELQTDIVAICLEYVENQADDIYIYCSYEPKMYAFDVFYKINGHIVLKNNLNKAVENQNEIGNEMLIYDTSEQRQEAVLDIGLKDLKEIHKRCKEFGREMPTEIKLHYNVKQNSLKGKYRYDLVYSNDDELLPDDIFDSWFEEVKKNS
ncbi:DUF600 domain-containing protein [Radiobacillus kanasensis]|uniref:DUF600 domain-containing protein n=1 Tax=Radiobacillus kanasensis TaxID=2844358 RepID=UPI001E54ABB7|nr:DUF600 domain-containing protein [Radiobacillus kanasensis]UFT98911.1 DUF600 domain-containing protein [Radiobacillus kanasensis]